jgi:nucleoside-specific outer membrane channel protein Tsx
MQLILYTKPGCHLCEGLYEKLQVIKKRPARTCDFTLEIRDIMTRDDWFQMYHYEVPILTLLVETELDGVVNQEEKLIPRMSPRLTVDQVEENLCKYL